MNNNGVNPQDLKIDPSNKNWTSPRSWGVWEIVTTESTKKFRYGNYPIRGQELLKEFGNAELIVLYEDEQNATLGAKELNQG